MLRRTILGVFLGGITGGLWAQSQAVVTDVQGKVTWPEGQAVAMLSDVPALKAMQLEKGAKLTLIMLGSGEELLFQGPAKVTLTAKGQPQGAKPKSRRKVASALNGAVSVRKEKLARAAVVMRSAPKPSNKTAYVLEKTPTFTWDNAGDGVCYTFQLRAGEGVALFQDTTKECQLTLPQAASLKENITYTWQVDAKTGDEVVSTQSGQVALLSKADRAKVVAAKPKASASFSQRLLYGLLLDKYQLQQASKAHWEALKAERPEDPTLKGLKE